MPNVAAIVLAAGESHRMGRPKQLIDWHGQPLLQHVLRMVERWPISELVVVIGANEEALLAGIDFGSATVISNPEWREGMASSIRVGLDWLERSKDVEGVFIALGDQPVVPDDVPPALIEVFEETGRQAVVPKYRYQQANPVLLKRSLWSRFMSLSGDRGGADLLASHPAWVEEVWFDRMIPHDIDTPDDLDTHRRGTVA